jgi:hypothetical protein
MALAFPLRVPEKSIVWGWTATTVILGRGARSYRDWASPPPHLHRDWALPSIICNQPAPALFRMRMGAFVPGRCKTPQPPWLHADDACRPAGIAYGRCAAHMGTRSTHTGPLPSADGVLGVLTPGHFRPPMRLAGPAPCASRTVGVLRRPLWCATHRRAVPHRASSAQGAPIGVVPLPSRPRACTATLRHRLACCMITPGHARATTARTGAIDTAAMACSGSRWSSP